MIGRRQFPDYFSTIQTVIIPNLRYALSSTVCLIETKSTRAPLMAGPKGVSFRQVFLQAENLLRRFVRLARISPVGPPRFRLCAPRINHDAGSRCGRGHAVARPDPLRGAVKNEGAPILEPVK